jgi:protein phosphatase
LNNPETNTDLKISFCSKSDVGKIREQNEDFMGDFKCESGRVFVVCDGLGGHAGGEIASKLAVNTIKEFITENPKKITDISILIFEALNTANIAILNKAKKNTELKGMGTTCVILILIKGLAYFGNVGDSRLYLIREEKIKQISIDQSYVQELIDKGIISPEQAKYQPGRNIVLQALGNDNTFGPQLNPGGMEIFKNDKFILCSDGLSGMLSDNEILDTAEKYGFPGACEKLVEFANAMGGIDNITVQVIQIDD